MSVSETDSKPVKVLAVGAGVGSIRELISKINTIDAKHGKFDFVLCTGNFFGLPESPSHEKSEGDDLRDLLEGRLDVPIVCYLMQGEHPLPDSVIHKYRDTGGELCKNVFLLNKSGILTTANGIKIACLGGSYDPEIYTTAEAAPGFSSPFFSAQTTARLLSNALTESAPKNRRYTSLAAIRSTAETSPLVDILMSNAWPICITDLSSAPLPSPELASIGAPPLNDVIRHIKPRYHFAAGGGSPPQFWEREPFVWDDEAGRVTRFVSLGAFGGKPTSGKKQRWFYAFSISPSDTTKTLVPRPQNATQNPFTSLSAPQPAKRPVDMSEVENFIFGAVNHPTKRTRIDGTGKPPPGYKCKRCEATDHFINDCPARSKPPDGYICKICGTPGHLVRDCPTRHAVGDTGGKKPREGYVCRACGSDAHYLDDCPAMTKGQHGGKTRGPPKEIAPDECWFCLSNPNLAKHLIVSIGSECYLTLPKGQIIPTHNSSIHPNVPGGGHVLIVPITHYPTLNSIAADLAAPILEETNKYKSALRAMFAKHNSVPVFFEVGRQRAKGGHAHVQVVPIPHTLSDQVEEAFLREGGALGIDFKPETADAPLDPTLSYFRVELPSGKTIVHLMRDHVPFRLQFGRQVLVSLLKTPERLDWKDCTLSEEDDKEDAHAFKTAFAPFDQTQ